MTSQVMQREAVLFLFGTLEIGGSEAKFVGLANRLTAEGLPVHIAYLRPPDLLLDRIRDAPTIHLHRQGKWSRRAYRNLATYVEQHDIRSIVTVNLYPLTYALPLKLFKRSAPVRVLSSINTSEFFSTREQLFMKMYVPMLKRADCVVFGSQQQKQYWQKRYGLSSNGATVIYNGVDEQRFKPSGTSEVRDRIRSAHKIDSEAVVIACVGQLRPEKAHGNLLQAIALLRQRNMAPYVLLIGDGDERENLQAQTRKADLAGHIIFCGAVDDVRPYLEAADIFALTSVAVETFSNAALEAAAMGLPAVISDVGGAQEMFPQGSAGTIYPRNDIGALAEALATSIAKVQGGEFVSETIRQQILEKFATGQMDRAWKDVIWP